MSKFLKLLVTAGLLFSAGLTALGVLANWFPALDIVNNGLPIYFVGTLALLALAFAAGGRKLIGAAAVLLAVIVVLLLAGIQGGAPQAPDGSKTFLRVATFNLWGPNDDIDRIAAFFAETNADAVVLEEVRSHHAPLLEALRTRYPYRAGDDGLVILSKHPIVEDSRLDRPGYPPWISLMVRRAKLDVTGTMVELAGVHLARPFYPDLQYADIVALTAFVQSRSGPLNLAGDFNMAPWTVKLKTFTRATGLGRFNTFCPTWPARRHDIRLLPILPIDNVFASSDFASIRLSVGPYLGSDHLPVITDIALVE
ncbi:MAG: endonuclease/exonuclease/phosphatase family protein [Hyphomicrobiales bacterium]